MDKKVALITGGSRGIGKAIALTLGKSDYHVIINYRSREDEAVKVLDEIIAGGGSGSIYQSDISNYNETEKMMTDIIKEHGGIDVLVNNAGITKDQLMLRMSEEDFSSVIDINLKGAFNCVKHVTRSMFKKRSGCIINISSVIGLVGNAGQVNYAASKAGIIGMTKALAKEYAARNIRVNAIAPGFIDTEMTDVLSEEIKQDILDKIPLHTLGRPEDIANMVNFLASDQAKYITGQVIAVDGGMTM
jgi:3-oxoacyl-[acyl-carrier protein] reductase